jgi:AcrR family transcriptional regulator
MTRRYELKERARTQEQTRRRIVDAAAELHEEIGPARTTVTEIARRAGVGRVTVYNHFPDEATLLDAFTEQWFSDHPPPDPRAWTAIENPARRLRDALTELYAYYRENQAMLSNLTRDTALVPALAEAMDEQGTAHHERALREALLSGRVLRGGRTRRAAAAIGLALAFTTWQQLTQDEGLTDKDAVKLMVKAIEAP